MVDTVLEHPGKGRVVLTRKRGQTIVVADMITIEVMECSPGKCKLAVYAPRDLAVNRGEVQARVEEEQRLAGEVTRAEAS